MHNTISDVTKTHTFVFHVQHRSMCWYVHFSISNVVAWCNDIIKSPVFIWIMLDAYLLTSVWEKADVLIFFTFPLESLQKSTQDVSRYFLVFVDKGLNCLLYLNRWVGLKKWVIFMKSLVIEIFKSLDSRCELNVWCLYCTL